MKFNFEWDPKKAAANKGKHKVSFEQAATLFLDPRALTLFDDEHSSDEDRWITLGVSSASGLLVVNHTYHQSVQEIATIRIISCRKATKREQQQYRARQ